MGVFLSFLVWGVDLDCAVDTGGGDGWFVGMACCLLTVLFGKSKGTVEYTLDNINNLAIPLEDINQFP